MSAKLLPLLLLALLPVSFVAAQVDQRPGPDGEFGKPYAINREYPLQFTLEKVDYTLSPVRLGENARPCGAEEKLLRVYFAVQNAQKVEWLFRFDSIRMTAVDTEQNNHEYSGDYAKQDTGEIVSMQLKPAQKIRCYAVIPLPAKVSIAKLIILPNDDADPVIRYAVAGKIGKLPAGWADPKDETGLTPLPQLAAKLAEWAVIGNLSVRVDASARATDQIADVQLDEGKVWHAVTITLRNDVAAPLQISWAALDAVLVLEDETEVDKVTLVMAKAGKVMDMPLAAGAERAVRLFFALGPDDKPATLRIRGARIQNGTDGESRWVLVPLAEPKPAEK
ncbi:MAG: hypothetical protein HZB16_05535 [Armatimonadetes bacterium]|nr:hypothetical protein [Armatimonadota bacterium]